MLSTPIRRTAKLAAALLLGSSAVALTASPTLASPRRASSAGYLFGIDTYVTYNCVGSALMDTWASNVVEQYKALRANSIGIGFPIYTDSITSNRVSAKDVCNNFSFQSPSPGILAGIIKIAHAAGLTVLLRPLIDQTNLTNQRPENWRGILKPTDLRSWFTSYMNTLKPYLRMAQENHVEHFALETELDSLAAEANWNTAVTTAHRIYQGDLAWNYSWDASQRKVTRKGTSFAVDAYPPLPGASVGASAAKLASMWGALLAQARYHLPNVSHTTIDEIDIPAQSGAYAVPYATSLPLRRYPFNETVQARWFTAACSFVKDHHLRGIYYWGPWLSHHGGALLTAPDRSRPTDIQPAAQAAIKTCFARS